VKLQFDPNQPFQLDAIAAVTSLFKGQIRGAPEYSIINLAGFEGFFSGQIQTELGVGNRLVLAEEKLQANTRDIQAKYDIEIENPASPLDSWELFDAPANISRRCPHFSVEMETGTGKTYVYLRTIFELSQRYGFQKYIIVVPSIAIREGVLKNIEITTEHFRTLFNNPSFEYFVYDAKKINRLRQFAVSNTLQICIINIQAFNKKEKAVIYKENDKLSGRQPIEFVQATRPIVIIDEPQSVEGGEEGAGLAALKELNPICTLRYSATHRNPHNLVYRLDPIRAFELKLVKQIVVASATTEDRVNEAFIRVEGVEYKKGIKARLRIHVQTTEGPKEKIIAVKNGDDLFQRSQERASYQHGFSIVEINAEPGNEFVRFNNGLIFRLGEETGGLREDIWRAQIKHTVRKHLDKELLMHTRGIKVLTLFFIDRVANYRDYNDEGQPIKGRLALALEAELSALATDERYKALGWLKLPLEQLHNGYFAQDKKGYYKNTRGDSEADDEVYNLIMKDKERLLSLDEPLRFIFSHSALREGWDNPNVFQICTLNETRSAIKKRQEIGRGLRLPVDQNGLRVFDESVNKLYVMANESYEDFARTLQTEYEDDCGVTFGKIPLSALAKITRIVEGIEQPVGYDVAKSIQAALVEQEMIDAEGRIQTAFEPKRPNFKLDLPSPLRDLTSVVIDLLASYQIERHVQKEKNIGQNRLRKEVQLGQDFTELWNRIKQKTTYRIEFETDKLVSLAIDALKRMEKIESPKISVVTGQVGVTRGGVSVSATGVAEEKFKYTISHIPDLLAYLQNETELTRSTLVRILRGSGRLGEFFNNPQLFMDRVAENLKQELHRLLVDGIKYERISGTGPEAEWEQLLFEDEELINYLTALQVNKSVYEYVVYESEIEREFARKLDERQDIRLFVKLPAWFKIDTPVGEYNPDWAIIKHHDETVYMIRETKGTRDFLKLRNVESDKVRCGYKHFEEIGVSFAVVTAADQV
jgi:type III restriction enzyme